MDELKVDKITNKKIIYEFLKRFDYFKNSIRVLIFKEKSDEVSQDSKLILKCQIIYANEI